MELGNIRNHNWIVDFDHVMSRVCQPSLASGLSTLPLPHRTFTVSPYSYSTHSFTAILSFIMPSASRKQLGTSHSLRRSKPYDKQVSVQQPSYHVRSDDGDSDPISEARILDLEDKPGFPTYVQYKRIEAAYLESLSPRKRNKALISQSMFDKIWDVLHQPNAPLCTPQFRFWVHKMFTLSEIDAEHYVSEAPVVILHGNRPVAVQEQLYELLCYCHEESNHGGRDKTCAVIREHYSWVPKDLTARFVKVCPTCTSKRSRHQLSKQFDRTPLRKRKQEQVEESEGSLTLRDHPEENEQSTEGPHGQSTITSGGIVDVAVTSWNSATEWPSTYLPTFNWRGASSSLLLPPLPSLLTDFNDKHSKQMDIAKLCNPSKSSNQLPSLSARKGDSPPLTSDIANLCSPSRSSNVQLPSLSDVYWNDTKDDQYKLSDLWPENISDSLPLELQRFQLSSPVHTGWHVQNEQINPALLPFKLEAASWEEEDYMSNVSSLSPHSSMSAYSALDSCISPYSVLHPLTLEERSGEEEDYMTRSDASLSPYSRTLAYSPLRLDSCVLPRSILDSSVSPYSPLSSVSPMSDGFSGFSPPSPGLHRDVRPISPVQRSDTSLSPQAYSSTSAYSPFSLDSCVSPCSTLNSSMSPYSSLSSVSPMSDGFGGFSPPSPDLHRDARPISLTQRLGLTVPTFDYSQSWCDSMLAYLLTPCTDF